MKLSNSLIRSVLTNQCEYFLQMNMDGKRFEPTKAMTEGLVFEHQLLGETMTGQEPHLPLLKTGSMSKPEMDIRLRADEILAMLPDMGIEILETQTYLEDDNYTGHPDAVIRINGSEALMDVKWTRTKLDDRYNGWGDIEQKLSDVEFQHIIYPLMDEMKPFYYLLVSPTWIRLIKVTNSQSSLEYFEKVVDNVRVKIEQSKGKPIGDYNTCRTCLFLSQCDKATKIPNVEEVEL